MIRFLNYVKIFSLILFVTPLSSFASFPIPIEERRQEQIGSILQNDNILSTNKHENSVSVIKTSKKHQTEDVNYIWLAALENVKFMPLNSTDYNGGVIITDWLHQNKHLSQRFKISIFIKNSTIALSSFEVNIYSEEFKKNRWVADQINNDPLKIKMTNDIFLLAKQLYNKSKNK